MAQSAATATFADLAENCKKEPFSSEFQVRDVVLPLTTQDADDLYESEKWIVDDVKWVPEGKFRYVKIPVFTKLGEILMLRAVYGRKFSFNLLYRDHYPIRRWDFAHRGKNVTVYGPDKKPLRVVSLPEDAGHKHRWAEDLGDRDIYLVDDIPLDDVNAAFHAYLAESKIALRGAYHPVF
jgi:hypothetical protein